MTEAWMLRLVLSEAEVAWAHELACETHERWAQKSGHYPNWKASHYVGRCGEIAVLRALQQNCLEVDEVFRDCGREHEADLVAGAWRLDVKTWGAGYWTPWGRCVAASQLRGLQQKADAIIWCTHEGEYTNDDPWDTTEREVVTIRGWSPVADIKMAPVRLTGPRHNLVRNHQLDESQLRTWDDLLEELTRPDSNREPAG